MVRKISKKISKDTIIPLTRTEKLIAFINENINLVMTSLIVLLVCVMAISGFILYKKKINKRSYINEYKALKLYRIYIESNQGFNRVENAYLNIIKKYPDTKGAMFARLYLGNAYYEKTQYAKAIDQYRNLMDRVEKESELYEFAILGMAYSYEALEEYQKAISLLKEITENEKSSNRVEAYISMARCYEELGDNRNAIDNYSLVMKRFPNNQWKLELINKISELRS